MRIACVKTKKQLKEFIKLPWKIYSKESPWVPPLISDIKNILSLEKNPFWAHAKRELFLAYDDNGNTIGRVAAIIDDNYIKFQNDVCGFFGFFECINDVEVAKSLLEAVQNWLKSNNINKMIGPMSPSTNDEMGFVSDGIDKPPSIMMTYTQQYYLDLVSQCGLNRVKELYAYNMAVCADYRVSRLQRIVDMAKKKMPHINIRTLNIKKFDKELRAVMSVYNRAWEKNWGFVPWTDEEFEDIAIKLKPLIDTNLAIMAEVSGEPIGMLVSTPDYNQVLKKLNGRLFPFGFLKFMYYKNKIDSLRLIIMGVIKEYRNKGVEALMYSAGLNYAVKKGYKYCELSWILEDNLMTNRTAEMMDGKIYKKYLVFGKEF
jgi:GNAT superfamily N-acetyltransferase